MPVAKPFRVADLPPTRPVRFDLRPEPADLRALAQELDLIDLRKLRFCGRIEPHGSRDWLLTGTLGATVVQPCVVTLDPVTTRIETTVRRLFLAGHAEPQGDEVEMPEDETLEPLGAEIDPAAVMAEELALALPLYPRRQGADLGEAVFTEPGREPVRDADLRPFAGLAHLRDTLKRDI